MKWLDKWYVLLSKAFGLSQPFVYEPRFLSLLQVGLFFINVIIDGVD